jgi:transposase
VLYVSFELSNTTWKLTFTTGMAQAPRLRSVPARDRRAVLLEIARAKERFKLPANTPVNSCYEAGRDGFWLHRFLLANNVENLVVDSASIEVNRRQRRAKSDSLDGNSLVRMLIRWHNGETKVWSVVQVPSADDEDGRQLHRELVSLKDERTEHINRVKAFLATIGQTLPFDRRLLDRLDGLRQWDGTPIPPELRARIVREFHRWKLVDDQIHELESEQRRRMLDDTTPGVETMRLLLGLKGIGVQGAWFLTRECFAWRHIANRRQVASLMGLAPVPYGSGEMQIDRGISKAGSKWLRWLMVQLSWTWHHYQPRSRLIAWFEKRFARNGSRMRKVGIVAVARKLAVTLWKYVARGEVPEGAVVVPWELKLGRKPRAAQVAAAN